jgi:anhydro-N-acetylmuramic acid kinase
MSLYLGLMSGTSLDGVDGALVDFSNGRISVRGHAYEAFPSSLSDTLLALNTPGDNELHRCALAANALVEIYSHVVERLLRETSTPSSSIRAIGAHGQTVRHRPGEFDGIGYSAQLNSGALLAERTGIDVVCDFRSRDVAAGGQGAPLVPAFHAVAFQRPGSSVAVLNIGGIANLTLIPRNGPVTGFDCGPGNALLDAWCLQHTGSRYDDQGRWAAGGQVVPALLGSLMSEPFLKRTPPKSTGRDLFNASWLKSHIDRHAAGVDPRNVQATLAEFTARAACEALGTHQPDAADLLVCGGGALNLHLMQRLAALAPNLRVQPTDAFGVPAMQVEAAAFAWLAQAFVERIPGNRPEVTGARGPRVLGALYPA